MSAVFCRSFLIYFFEHFQLFWQKLVDCVIRPSGLTELRKIMLSDLGNGTLSLKF